MARGRRTNLPMAALALEMREKEGRSEREIAAATGLPKATVHDIVNKAKGWDEIAEGPVFAQHRAQQNKCLEQAARSLAAKAYTHAEKVLDKASFYQAVYGGSILVDKARLLAGESTENVAVVHRHEVEALGQLAKALSKSLITWDDGSQSPAKTVLPQD